MDEKVIESFIAYCDDMTIAEEGFKEVKEIYAKADKYIDDIKEKLENENFLQKRIALYTEMKGVVAKLKGELENEKATSMRDLPSTLKGGLVGTLIGAVTAGTLIAGKKQIKTENKLQIGTVGGIASIAAAIQGLKDARQKKIDTKKEYIDFLNKVISSCDQEIKFCKIGLSRGYKTLDKYKRGLSGKNVTDSKNSRKIMEKILSGIKPVGNPPKYDAAISQMVNETISFLKRYSTSKEFKEKYKDYLYMIDIEEEGYGSAFSIQITEFQDGVDYDREDDISEPNTDWYRELLYMGKEYIKIRFKPWKGKIWSDVNTGDGDEGNIYVENCHQDY